MAAPTAGPLVTYIIGCLNEEEHMHRLLTSLSEQDHRPMEVLVVDGGSRDRTQAITLERAQALNAPGFTIRLLKEEDYGPLRSLPNARNIGVQEARGECIILLDADFFLVEPDFTGKVARELANRRSTSVRVTFAEDTPVERYLAPRQPPLASVAYRRDVFEHHRFNPRLGYGEDEYFWLKAGIDIDHVCDATVGRHTPHTWGEYYAQLRWYGRTLIPFMKAMKADHPERYRTDLMRKHVINRVPRALFYVGALPAALLLSFLSPWAGLAAFLLFLLVLGRNLLKDHGPEPLLTRWRLVATDIMVASAGFTAGLLKGLWQQRRGTARVGRD